MSGVDDSVDAGSMLDGIEDEVLDIVRSSSRCGLTSTVDEVQERLAAGNRHLAIRCAAAIEALERSGRIVIEGGEIALHGHGDVSGSALERRKRAGDYLSFGRAFLESVTPSVPDVIMAGICGSVSYGSAGPADDVDIILICRNGALWSVMKKVLLRARALRKKEPWRPVICLSYCADDAAFREEAANHRTGLFASDCLNIRVVKGEDYYLNVLSSNPWMRSRYPSTYDARVGDGEKSATYVEGQNTFRNRLDYMLVGNYLRAMARGRNMMFRLRGNEHALFTARIEKDRCVYASERWKRLEEG